MDGRGNSDIPIETLRRLLRLDHTTGKLFWLERTPDLFAHCEAPDAYCRSWNARYAGREAFTALNKGYLVGRIFDRIAQAGRVAFALANGHWPENNVDHIDGDPLNNRPENLRDVTQAENMKNACIPKHNTSGMMGVWFNPQSRRWQAQIMVSHQRIHLGCFGTATEAVAARSAAERRFGFHPNHGRSA